MDTWPWPFSVGVENFDPDFVSELKILGIGQRFGDVQVNWLVHVVISK